MLNFVDWKTVTEWGGKKDQLEATEFEFIVEVIALHVSGV
jgi:hypothetical protein